MKYPFEQRYLGSSLRVYLGGSTCQRVLVIGNPVDRFSIEAPRSCSSGSRSPLSRGQVPGNDGHTGSRAVGAAISRFVRAVAVFMRIPYHPPGMDIP